MGTLYVWSTDVVVVVMTKVEGEGNESGSFTLRTLSVCTLHPEVQEAGRLVVAFAKWHFTEMLMYERKHYAYYRMSSYCSHILKERQIK